MSSPSSTSKEQPSLSKSEKGSGVGSRGPLFPPILHLPKNVYLLLIFTLGKGFQLSIANLVLNLYVHSLGYQPDFVGLFSAVPALGALIGALPSGILADRIGRKPLLLMTAILSPLFLAVTGLMTSAPLLLFFTFLQGLVSTAYWVTNVPLLTESTREDLRVGVLAFNSFLLLGVGALGNLLGGAVPELVAALMHIPADSTIPLRWGVILAASFTLIFGFPLWFIKEPRRLSARKEQQVVDGVLERHTGTLPRSKSQRAPVILFVQLLLPDLLFTMGEGAVVALMQLYFVLRFSLQPGPLGIIFTISGLAGGIFSLTAPLFAHRWGKLRLVTTIHYLSAPLMILIGYAPFLSLAIAGEYARSFMRLLIEPVYAAFAMEQVSDRQRATLAGMYSVTWSVGFSIGPTIAGWLQSHVSLSSSFIFGACCLVMAATLLLTFFGRKTQVVAS